MRMEIKTGFQIETNYGRVGMNIHKWIRKDGLDDYLEGRIKEVAIMLANYEDSIELLEGTDLEKAKEIVEVGRAKIDELKRLQNHCRKSENNSEVRRE